MLCSALETAYSRWLTHSQIQTATVLVTQGEAVAGEEVVVVEAEEEVAATDGNLWLHIRVQKYHFMSFIFFFQPTETTTKNGPNQSFVWCYCSRRMLELSRMNKTIIPCLTHHTLPIANTFIFSNRVSYLMYLYSNLLLYRFPIISKSLYISNKINK